MSEHCSKKSILYIHGKGGSSAEAEAYQKACPDFNVIGVDYDGSFPWTAQEPIRRTYDRVSEKQNRIIVLANSIGAYFAMHALQTRAIEKALFISPILDMEQLILGRMRAAGISESELRERGAIPCDFGEPLSWKDLCFVRENPIVWEAPTEILCAGSDPFTPHQTVEAFAAAHSAGVTIMENGEHWFHTGEQLAFLETWLKKSLSGI